jgi:TolB-like protein/Tfp pilus assembly protein PilF
MLTGEPPYTGASSRAILAKQLTGPLPRVTTLRQVPPAVDAALTRALAPSPADRFDSVGAFSRELSAADGARGPTRAGRRTWVLTAAALAVVAGLVVTVRQFRQGNAGATEDLSSAAVLPFLDLSPGHDQAYFSDGLTDELTNALGRIPTLRMAARTSAFQFRGPGVDVRDVGQKLRVATVLEGSVRKMGDRLHVNAQLVGTRDGFELWSETYDRQLADVFAVQEEIARAIASALRIRLTGKADSALVERPTASLEAYDFYLQGQFALNQRTNASITEAIRLFEQAVARDSGLAKAWAGMADAYVLQPQYSGTSPTAAWPRGKAAAQRAIALKPGLAEAHTSLAYGTMLYDWNWPAAEREFQIAIAADPSYPTARHWYGDFLAGRNRLEEALQQMHRAHELDPLSRITSTELAWVYTSLHRTTEADSIISQVLRLDPRFPQATLILGMLRLLQHRAPEAVVAFKQSLADGGFNHHTAACLIAAYAAAGDRPAAMALLDTLKRRSTSEYVPPSVLALAYAGLGDLDQAFVWLDRGLAERDALLPECFFETMFDPLKADPRYKAAAARLQ